MPTRKWGSEILVTASTGSLHCNTKVASLVGGGYVVVWEDSSSGNTAVYGQVFNALGIRSGGELTLAASAGIDFQLPDVTGLADGNFYVTATQRVGVDNYIVGAVWATDGALVRAQQVVFAFGLDSDSDVARLGTGSVVAWEDPGTSSNNILFRIFDSAGNGGSLMTANTSTQKFVATPDVAASPDGQTIAIVWTDPDSFIMRARLFDGVGTGITPEFSIAAFSGVEDYEPTVTWLNQGEFAVSWRENHPSAGGGNQIFVRIFDSQAATPIPLTGNILVNSTTLNDQLAPQITALPNGGFVVTWQDNSATGGDQSGSAIRLQAFDGAGGKVGGEFLVNTTTQFNQESPSITALSDGRIVVTWTTVNLQGDYVYSQIIDPRDGIVTGTAAADILYGHDSVGDEISGYDGADMLYGLKGDDSLYGGAGQDIVTGGGGDDTAYGGAGADDLRGNNGDDALFGEDGNDTLRGGAGADDLDGGAGKDTASYISATSAVVISLDGSLVATGEAAGDTLVRIENLTGSNLTAAGDTLKGDGQANVLSGLAGGDTLIGGNGNDTLIGGRGADTLSGGAGNDVFAYASLSEAGDSITDFSSAAAGNNDSFQFKGTAFGGLPAGALAAIHFQTSLDNVALTADVRFIYESDTRSLWYDADGSGAGAAVLIATLQAGATMTAGDIFIM